ncbi:MAG: FAD-dependent oxidoreductase [Bacteroidales bacterium]
MKYLIIGGVAGGATTAARIRRNDEQAEIILFEKGSYISYANCGLPYYIGDVIKERENLFLQTPESFGKRLNVDVRIESEVTAINKEVKTVTIRKSDGTQYSEEYDKLLLSPGATPIRPALPGIDSNKIFTLRNVNDTDAIKNYIDSHRVQKAVVIGAGFIGLEMAENLHEKGIEVSIVEMAPQVMAPIDFSMASLVHQHLTDKGVHLHLGETVTGFASTETDLKVEFKNGTAIDADLVILAIGVRPATALAAQSGLTIGEAGGIKVDEYLRTSDPNIYAVGDAIEYPHPITGKPWLNYLAGPANRQGRIAADNMVFGNTTKYEGSIGTGIAKVFDMTVASTGLPAKRLQQMGIEYASSTTHSGSHAGYYPGATQLTIKITFDKSTGKLFGAQVVGFDGVDKRLDQLALILKQGGTIHDLTLLEHAYAPPFSSAKDPVAMAGYVAENIMLGKMKPLYWREMQQADLNRVTILDVRTREEFEANHIDYAINIPVDELRSRLHEIPTDKAVYVYCAIGLRGYLASRILMQNGFEEVKNLSGGCKLYNAATQPVKRVNCRVSLPESNEDLIDLKTKQNNTVLPFMKEFKTLSVDACGLQCPGPILKMKKSIDEMQPGERMEMVATDAGFPRDAAAWCNTTGHKLISQHNEKGRYTVVIEKTSGKGDVETTQNQGKGKTLILFSDDLDKALATFVLANGAAATGEKVTIFFTFWGLNALKKVKKPSTQKDLFGKMFSMMLPSHSGKLGLSKMNMGGMGSKMMRFIMKKKGIESLEALRQQAIESGVEFIACQMSMDVMGVNREELLDEVTIGGVATYMERADQANVNLFI